MHFVFYISCSNLKYVYFEIIQNQSFQTLSSYRIERMTCSSTIIPFPSASTRTYIVEYKTAPKRIIHQMNEWIQES
jgi:hypothetical protein